METQKTFTPHGAPIRNAKLLPVQPPGQVIGRNQELASMHVTLKVGSSVLLSGQPGIGKTALASVLAAAYIASNPGGVLWFNTVEDDFELLVARVGRAYGLNALTVKGDETTSNAELVRALLEKNKPLIVLDGLVDLDAARDFVRQCATKTPVIIANEQTGAGPWTPIGLEALTPEDSVALLTFYSGLSDPLYQADIEGLCKFLNGIPVAIELAARQLVVDDVTPAELLTTLPSSAGQDSAYMMMSVVFKRLPPPVQAMLLVLASLSTGAATAELISDLSKVPAPNIIPLMRQLVARGVAKEYASYGQSTYMLQESAQHYTRNWLEQYQRLQATETRALQAVVAYTDRHARNTVADHDRLAAELDNILGMAAYATSIGQAAPLRQLILALSQKAGDFINLRGFQPELNQLKKLQSLLAVPAAEGTPQAQPGQPPVATSAASVVSTASTANVTPPPVSTPVPAGVPEASAVAAPPALPESPADSASAGVASVITEPPVDADATPFVRRLPQLPKPPEAAQTPVEDEKSTQELQTLVSAAVSLDQTQPAAASEETLIHGSVDIQPHSAESESADSARSLEAVPLPERSDQELAVAQDIPPFPVEPDGAVPAESAAPVPMPSSALQTPLPEGTGPLASVVVPEAPAEPILEPAASGATELAIPADLAAMAEGAAVPEITVPSAAVSADMSSDLPPLPEATAPKVPGLAIAEPPATPDDTETPTPLSVPTIEQQLKDARQSGDQHTEATLLQTLGQFYADQGQYSDAEANYKQALQIYESRNDNDGILATLDALSAISAQHDNVQDALVYATRGANLAQQIGDKDRLGRFQSRLGDVRVALGDLPAAITTYTQAVESLRSTENWLSIGIVMARLGDAYLAQNKLQESQLMLEQALSMFRKERNPVYEGQTLGALGLVFTRLKQWPKAQQYLEQGLAVARQNRDQYGEADQLAGLANFREMQGDKPSAIEFYRQALHVSYMVGSKERQSVNALELGRLLLDDTRTLEQAVEMLRESNAVVSNSEARRLLNRAEKRLERTRAAGMEVAPAEGSSREYASAAYGGVHGEVPPPGMPV